uniref:Uncharacterized protein n=1 Tax=Glossina palpalis gambiensis TaxID=67801 RepID=A0A1B0BB82_9MUSC
MSSSTTSLNGTCKLYESLNRPKGGIRKSNICYNSCSACTSCSNGRASIGSNARSALRVCFKSGSSSACCAWFTSGSSRAWCAWLTSGSAAWFGCFRSGSSSAWCGWLTCGSSSAWCGCFTSGSSTAWCGWLRSGSSSAWCGWLRSGSSSAWCGWLRSGRSYVGINEEIMWVSIGMGVTIAILITIALCYIAREKCQKRQREYYLAAVAVTSVDEKEKSTAKLKKLNKYVNDKKEYENRTTKSATTSNTTTTNNNATNKMSAFNDDNIYVSTINMNYSSVTGQPHYSYNDYTDAQDHHHQQQYVNQHATNRSNYQYVNNFHHQQPVFYHSHQRLLYELPVEILLPAFPNPVRHVAEWQPQNYTHYSNFWNNRSWVPYLKGNEKFIDET